MAAEVRYWAVIPAAGVGARMGVDVPKQYLQIHAKPVIEYSLDVFCRHPRISGVMVALSAQDMHWKTLTVSGNKKITTTAGGAERCHSVLNCLQLLSRQAQAEDWVLVHDAARPCLQTEDIDRLIAQLSNHACGGLLAVPVRDTMKRAETDNTVSATVNREGLWHALTPQMFRLGALTAALQQAIDNGHQVTDEAQAMELTGAKPLLVEGRIENIKITRPGDLKLAEMYLSQ